MIADLYGNISDVALGHVESQRSPSLFFGKSGHVKPSIDGLYMALLGFAKPFAPPLGLQPPLLWPRWRFGPLVDHF